MTTTRQDLLAATRTCVGRKGLAATTSRDITAEAGANLAAITYYFGSKEQLVADALLDEMRSWLAPTLDVLSRDGDPATRALLAIRTLTETFEQHRSAAPTFIQAIAHAPMMPPLQAGVVGLWADLRRLLSADIATMQQRADLPDRVDPVAMSALLVAVAHGLVLYVTVDPDGPTLQQMAAQLGLLLLSLRDGT